MKKLKGLPAGYESSGSDNEYWDDECVGIKTRNIPKIIVNSPVKIKKGKLLELVKEGNLIGIQDELDFGDERGFNIDESLDGHWNILFHACNLGSSEIVNYLVNDRGANVNATEISESPLMVACYSKADSAEVLKVVKILTNKAAMISLPDLHGVTALMYACANGHVEVVRQLLSLNDSYDAIDNEGKNALFYAIDGKNLEAAKLLVEAGIDLSSVDSFGTSAKQYAINEHQNDIVDLFPPEIFKYQIPTDFLSYNRFEDLIPETAGIPAYFPDVLTLLRGMDCENFSEKFSQSEVTLEEFLTITDGRLKEIGIEFPFERNLIRIGLLNFHKEPWSRQSLYIPFDFKDDLSSLDLVLMLANVLRQVVVIKSYFLYMQQLSDVYNLGAACDCITMDRLNEFKQQVKKLKKLISVSSLPSKNPLMISKKSIKKNLTTSIMKFTFTVPIIVICAFKIFKKS